MPASVGLAWCALAATFALLMLVVAPGRGAGWIQDDGLFLRMSWDAAHGYGFDQMLPQSPSYLFHSLFMQLGMSEYLHFRYLNYVVILLSSGIFFSGLARGRAHTVQLPLGILASLLVSLNSIQNPNALSQACFLIGTGIYFHAIHASTRLGRFVLHLLCGLFLGLAGFMHAAVAIATLLIAALILLLDRASRRSLLLPALLLSVGLLWFYYARAIGLNVLLARPAGHEVSAGMLGTRVSMLLLFYAKALLLFLSAAYYFRKRPEQLHQSRMVLDRAVTGFGLLSLLVFLADSGFRFPGWLGISQLPGAVLLLLYFGFFHWTWQQFQGLAGTPVNKLRAVWVTTLAQPQSRKLFIAFCGFVLVPAALAVGSNTAIIQGMVFFAGPALGLLIMLWSHIDAGPLTRDEKVIAGLWLLIFACFALTYNHPNYSPPSATEKITLQSAPLRGIRESLRYQSALMELQQAYRDHACQDKVLLVMDYLPMVYFILQHPAPNQIGVIRPQMYFPQVKIMELLQTSQSWCVLDATGIETQTDIDSSGHDKRAGVRSFIQQNADRQTNVAAPGTEILGSMQLYSRERKPYPPTAAQHSP
jgi:hypothetical protein